MEVFGNKYLHKKFKKTCESVQQENVVADGCFEPFKDNKITIESVPKQTISSSTKNINNGFLPSENLSSKIISNINLGGISGTVKVSSHQVPTTIQENKNYQNQIENSGANVYNFLPQRNFANVSSSNENLRTNLVTTLSTTEYSLNSSNSSKRIEDDSLIEETKNNTTQNESSAVPVSSAGNSTGNGKYVCTYCNLACSKPSVLQKHIRAHTNERPYPCVSCGFSFKTRSNLYKHCRSRTHANRVMGSSNKHAGETLEQESEKEDRIEAEISEDYGDEGKITTSAAEGDKTEQHKTKPYKPRFHTAKLFYEENDSVCENIISPNKNPNHPNFLKLRINELITKNNSIVNDDSVIMLRRKAENNNDYLTTGLCPSNPNLLHVVTADDQPLNLTLNSKNRKRCLSDSDNNCQSQKSLIKELLLKNLSTDPNLQCKYCKMIFQTVTELEMHSMKYCNAKTGNIRYARSSSVNVASILTQNKNAFDNIPHMQNTTFPLKSPGPFLGKTRLIENDKSVERRTFSFDDTVIVNNHNILDSPPPSFNKYMLRSPAGYPLSPQVKKNPIKLFGGEVKITQTSGETRSFKIESSDHSNKMICNDSHNFMDFKSGNLNHLSDLRVSENLVIKSTLGSGGTVLQNKSNYSPKLDNLQSPSVIRVYENNDLRSPNLSVNLSTIHNNESGKNKFSFDNGPQMTMNNHFSPEIGTKNYTDLNYRQKNEVKLEIDIEKELYKSNLIDFGQKAVKLLAPNLKPPNLTLPGLPVPSPSQLIVSNANKLTPLRIEMPSCETTNLNQIDLISFANKQINLQQRMAELPQPPQVLNPMNLIVNGKVVRYVPGIPGPVQAESPVDFPGMHQVRFSPKVEESPIELKSNPLNPPLIVIDQPDSKPKVIRLNQPSIVTGVVVTNTNVTECLRKSPALSTVSSGSSKEEPKKFVRPTSLALKPNPNSFKNHHGLTPTLFNQVLISPDTPRIAKKYCQQYLNGNYFSYLGLKSSTKSVYCTLNKTQPFYVKHFKKLSMYSEWRQQESKIDCLSVSAYDSRQKGQKYTLAGSAKADYIVHSSYKFVAPDTTSYREESSGKQSVLGGYESNEDYTYIRGRGRGRYVCDQCGIRCKKPSMLKKHIRTHSDDRPYTCEHCNFSFKTKGNLTKHMKSKAHFKKYSATSCTSNQNSVSTSSDSEDSETESDESTRLQDHEAAHCLLSLSQKNTTNFTGLNSMESTITTLTPSVSSPISSFKLSTYSNFLKNSDQITQVANSNFVKNKILDEAQNFNTPKLLSTEVIEDGNSVENSNNVSVYLGKSSANRPLTYPYFQMLIENQNESEEAKKQDFISSPSKINEEGVIGTPERLLKSPQITQNKFTNVEGNLPANIVFRKRKLSISTTTSSGHFNIIKQHRNSTEDLGSNSISLVPRVQNDVILDLSPTNVVNLNGDVVETGRYNGSNLALYNTNHERIVEPLLPQQKFRHDSFSESNSSETFSQNSDTTDRLPEKPNLQLELSRLRGEKAENYDTDQSAMQTLAEIAIKQVKLEKNILAKNVATEYLKLALNNDSSNPEENMKKFAVTTKESNPELMVKPEENKNCTICSKNFSKPSQLRLHMNIHYLERPFRCESCSVSFRTKGHLQKHERSAGHHNKLSTSPALSSSEPRPFKCQDCNVAFRIHGHLAKHLRSKLHIMKLECLAKIPFGLYAELERANSLLTEINTTDGDLCLESLKILARKLFTNDSNKADQLQIVSETRIVIFKDNKIE